MTTARLFFGENIWAPAAIQNYVDYSQRSQTVWERTTDDEIDELGLRNTRSLRHQFTANVSAIQSVNVCIGNIRSIFIQLPVFVRQKQRLHQDGLKWLQVVSTLFYFGYMFYFVKNHNTVNLLQYRYVAILQLVRVTTAYITLLYKANNVICWWFSASFTVICECVTSAASTESTPTPRVT